MQIAPPKWRGGMNILFQLATTVGILVAELINYGRTLFLLLEDIPITQVPSATCSCDSLSLITCISTEFGTVPQHWLLCFQCFRKVPKTT